jgi:Domain of unknown function (DUF5668)/B-box zinc finger
MNCANHADASAVAYCRTCGKALCANCTRPVRGVIYCEDCLGAKMEGVPAGTAAFAPVTFSPSASGQVPPPPPPPGSGSGPNPTVAGILAGFFPFGVGAVYTGQYAKGLAHLAIFGLLIAGVSASDNGHSEALGVICALGIAFFYVYQIIDAVRSARAIQMSQPIPDPFGLAATFSGGAKIETSKIPMGAVVLIFLGVLFLLHTMGLMEYGLDRFWPIILIGLGGWLFARNWGLLPGGCSGCGCARCRSRKLMGPAMILAIGFLFLLENVHVANFGRTWPVILLVIGGVKLLQGNASADGHIPPLAAGTDSAGFPIPPTPPVPPVPPVPPTSEVNRG